MRVDDALSGITRLALDTSPLIYYIESHPDYDDVTSLVFREITQGRLTAVTSVISMIEVLIHPLRAGNVGLYQQYRELLLSSRGFEVVSIDHAVAETAALMRSKHDLRIPDAVQLAAALTADCQAFLTNDKSLQRVTDIPVILLCDLDP